MLPGLSCIDSWTSLHHCGVSPSDHLWIMLENLLCVSQAALIQEKLHSVTSDWWYSSSQKIQCRCESGLQLTGLHSPPCRWATGLQKLQLNSALGQNNCYSIESWVFSFFCVLISKAKRRQREKQPNNELTSTHGQGEVLHILPAWMKSKLINFITSSQKVFLIHWQFLTM